jgi:CubicO group peptidase (beta-lactamase class C family)
MKNLLICLTVLLLPATAATQSLYFPPNSGNTWDSISPQNLGWCQPKIDSLYDFLELKNTKAFMVLKDGKIVLEQYFGTHTQNDLWYWASAGKTVTAFMTGIAQQEGFLNIDDTTSQYLGQGWTSCTPAQEEKITIRDQLSMTSGLNDAVPDHYCTLPSCLTYLADAGTRWAYHNGPYTLLDSVIENATGSSLNLYTFQKLLSPTGMNGTFYPVGYNNVFFSTARSMARFGLLMLNNGNWNGNQIMTDQNYFSQMVNTSQNLNESYGYLWWLNGKPSFMVPGLQIVFNGSMIPNGPADMFSAMGKNGQFLNVVPSQNLVWLRMGDAPDSSDVPFLLNDEIWSYINDLDCVTSLSESDSSSINVFPNPSGRDGFEVSGLDAFAETKLVVFDLQGRLVLEMSTVGKTEVKIEHQLQKGSYVIRVRGKHGQFTKMLQVI